MPSIDASPELIEELVDADHILFHQGIADAFGHVSVRNDRDPTRFLLARNLAPAQVTAADIVEYEVTTGEAVTPEAPRPYLARFIHSEIYRAPGCDGGGAQPLAGGAALRHRQGCAAAPGLPHVRLPGRGPDGVRDPRPRRRCHRPAHTQPRTRYRAGTYAGPGARGAHAWPRRHGGGALAAPGRLPRGLHRGERKAAAAVAADG